MIGGKKKCIGLIFGGHSNEHEVSISSAKTVFQAEDGIRDWSVTGVQTCALPI